MSESGVSKAVAQTIEKEGLPAPVPYRRVGVRIPLRDGVLLGADLITPDGESKGLIIVRGPYGRGVMGGADVEVWAALGYTVLFASSRGTADSEGVFDPMRDEQRDGIDLLDWVRRQEWYEGRFATLGGSYLGYTQWALLRDPQPDHVAAVIPFAPHDFAEHIWGTGTLQLSLVGWTDMQRALAAGGALRAIFHIATHARKLRRVLRSTPLVDRVDTYLGDSAYLMGEKLRQPDIDAPFWEPTRHGRALEISSVPTLLQGGWYDIFLDQTWEQYAALSSRNVDVGLTIGPWGHKQLVRGAGPVIDPDTLAWLDEHLAGIRPRVHRSAPVRFFVTGADSWVDFDRLPDPKPFTLHLRSDGGLGDRVAGSRELVYDPSAPTPTVGGNAMDGGGAVDDTSLAARSDVLVYDSAPLDADLRIIGRPVLTLDYETDSPDLDFFVRISEVRSDGSSHNVADGMARRTSTEGQQHLELALLPTAHVFSKGGKVRVSVAGGSFEQYPRNAGTGENPAQAVSLHRTSRKISAGSIRLPVA